MSRDDLRNKLSQLIDGELETAEAELLRFEIERDEDLREEYERLRRTSTAMKGYFQRSAASLVGKGTEEEETVERIVRQSRAGSIVPPAAKGRDRGRILLVAILIGVLGLALLVGQRLFGSDPSAQELGDRAREALRKDCFELRPRVGGLFGEIAGLLRGTVGAMPGELGDVASLLDPKTSILVGPEGRMHIRIELPTGVAETEEIHLGFDGERYWTWRRGQPMVDTFDLDAFGHPAQLVAWSRLARILDQAAEQDRLDLLGRVHGSSGSEGLWKLRSRGGPIEDGFTLWFDDQRRLRRVALLGVEFDVIERPGIGPESFRIENWAPGVPVKGSRKDEEPK